MKTYKHLWEEFIKPENFELACKNSQKRKKKHRQVRNFNLKRDKNLEKVRQSVINGTFHTGQYREKKIFEPKERIIYKLPYSPDRIVQHAIMNILEPILENLMIENTFSCIKNRGPLKASLKTSELVRKFDFCLKGDIRKFYPSICQKTLSEKMLRIIKDRKFMALLDDIIFSYPGGYNCPIGNYLSQWFGNYYLSFLDNYILHQLKPGGYIRYCDDFLLFSNDKSFLHDCKAKIETFINEQLELSFSKAQVFSVKQGVDFCGYRHFKGYVLVRKSTAKRMKRKFRKLNQKLDGTEEINLEKETGRVAAGNGLMLHACTHRLRISVKYDEIIEKLNARKEVEVNENTGTC